MSPPNWLPPVNSHHEFDILAEACEEFPKYDRFHSRLSYFRIKTIVSVNFKSVDEESNQRTFQGLACEKEFRLPCYSIASKIYFTELLSKLLTHDNFVPFELNLERLAEKTWEFASSMRQQASKNAWYNVLPFTLKITKEVKIPDNLLNAWNSWYDEKMRVDPDFENDYKKAISRKRTTEELANETTLLLFRAAVESSIEEIEKVMLDDSSSKNCCPICLEELVLGSKVTRLPCSHIFHGECIIKWLRESHMCPLCRFELPYVQLR